VNGWFKICLWTYSLSTGDNFKPSTSTQSKVASLGTFDYKILRRTCAMYRNTESLFPRFSLHPKVKCRLEERKRVRNCDE
jgi:hypothetical protein